MSARPQSFVNRIAEAMVRQITTHAEQFPDLWAKRPALVRRGVRLADESGPRPAVLVSTDGTSEPKDHGPTSLHRELQPLTILLLAAEGDDQEAAIHDLVADVKRALGWDWRLGCGDAPTILPVLSTGRLILQSVETAVGNAESGTPLGSAVVRLMAEYQWEDDAP